MSMWEIFKICAVILVFAGCDMSSENVRKSVCAGTWYSADKEELIRQISGFMENATKREKEIKAIIVPHAGYAYSGQVAAEAFKQLGKFKKAIILGTSHRYPLKGLSLTKYDYYETPLGKVKVCDEIRKEKIPYVNQSEETEHSIEMEIPFLQKINPKMCIIPLIVGEVKNELVNLLERYYDDDTIIIVSADLSHFHNYGEARELDDESINAVLNLDSEKIKECEIDNPYAISSLIEFAKKKNWNSELLMYKNSGDVTGDKSSVVGYGAIGFYESYYSNEEKEYMLSLAKKSVESYVKSGKRINATKIPDKLKERKACFVTLTRNGELRGCIGNLEPVGMLYEGIIDNAITAAMNDGRFEPVSEDELDELAYEVSVLTEPKKIKYKDEEDLFAKIKGKGVTLEKDGYSATYLPQVWEMFDNEEDFLSSLCQKAGLKKDEWKKGINVEVYEAIVIK